MRLGTTKLPGQRARQRGFTIVELLIVIIIIGILAAVTIVAYNGVTRRAQEASLKSDLRNAVAQLENDNTYNGSYPSDSSQSNQGQGLKTSGGTAFQYNLTPYGYCLTATNQAVPGAFVVRSSTKQIGAGDCSAVTTTSAGSGVSAYADGTGTAAQFLGPVALAYDSAGTLYVLDTNSTGSRVRKISPSGVVTTLAGSTNGYANGMGAAAQFNYPSGIAVDSNGNVYVADSSNNRIRKITPVGVVSTLAGSGVNGYANGTGTAAQFSYPNGIEVDSAGNLYVADSGSSRRIRVISPSGVVTTLAGSTMGSANGTGAAAQFGCFNGDPALDGSGNIYVADACNNSIRKITPGGVVTTIAGSTSGYADGTGTAAQFDNPSNLTVDRTGNIYVSELYGGRIRKVTQTGIVTTLAGDGESYGYSDGVGTAAQFFYPAGLVIDNAGALIVADQYNARIRKVTL